MQHAAPDSLASFLDSDVAHATLGLVYGRRRIGKSTLLASLARRRGGFYWEATRTESVVQLERLGSALGRHRGSEPLALPDWETALRALLRLGADGVPVVLDEFGHVLEADPSVASIVASLLGPTGRGEIGGRARLILCGSAIAMMRSLTAAQAPLRGRAGLELVMQPWDHRRAARLLGDAADLSLAARVFSVIGGVVGYATDVVDHDLPDSADDFDRWVAERVLSPSSPLHHEATTLLSEDPTLSAAGPVLQHAILGSIANGAVTAGSIGKRLRRPVSNLTPALNRLIAAGFVVRHADRVRARRPTYALADPFLQFHYAVLEPHGALLRARDTRRLWEEVLVRTFDSRVRGPVFEQLARDWVTRHAATETIGGVLGHVGPSTLTGEFACKLEVVVTSARTAHRAPSEREVLALGEAKAGARLDLTDLRRLERARDALSGATPDSKLLLFAPDFAEELRATAADRPDVELVDLARLYRGE